MAMIDAYRIGVGLVLGGDLAAGIAALIPGLERLDAGITLANAEAAALAVGLRGVEEAAPGIGRAADQMSRLGAAMAGVNCAVEVWRSGDGMPDPSRPRQGGDGVAAKTGLKASSAAGAGESAGSALIGRPRGPLDAVMPALLTDELVESSVGTSVEPRATDAALLANVAPVRTLQASALAQVAVPEKEAATEALPAYARDALASGGFERGGIAVQIEPARARQSRNTLDPVSGAGQLGQGRIEEIESVLPALAGDGQQLGPIRAANEPQRTLRQPFQIIRDTLTPKIGMPDIPEPVGERVGRFYGMSIEPTFALEPKSNSRQPSTDQAANRSMSEPSSHRRVRMNGLSRVLNASADEAARGLAMPVLPRTPTGLGAVGTPSRDRSDGTKMALTARQAQGSLFALTGGIVALSGALDTMRQRWPDTAKDAATQHPAMPGVVGAGLVPSLAAPHRNQTGGMNSPPQSHGYHPQGGAPGPVIEHVTYIHLDDREIARAVTRQQLRMMGGQVSGTLRPDPSVVPQYGAHLLEI